MAETYESPAQTSIVTEEVFQIQTHDLYRSTHQAILSEMQSAKSQSVKTDIMQLPAHHTTHLAAVPPARRPARRRHLSPASMIGKGRMSGFKLGFRSPELRRAV